VGPRGATWGQEETRPAESGNAPSHGNKVDCNRQIYLSVIYDDRRFLATFWQKIHFWHFFGNFLANFAVDEWPSIP
jgi:hypothetical protein